MLASIASYSLLAIAVIVAIGGIMGFVKAKSKASLISGVVSGALYVVAYVVGSGLPAYGLIGGAIVSALLCIVFGIRLKKTGQFMPAGMLLILCAAELLLLVLALQSAGPRT